MGLNTKKNGRTSQGTTALLSAGGTQEGLATSKIPSIGGYATPDHEYWFNGKGPNPSVTTVLRMMEKPAIGVFREMNIGRLIREVNEYLPLEWDPDDVARWARASVDEIRDTAGDLGSSVHLLAEIEGMPLGSSESDSKGFEVSEREKPYIDAYRGFLARYDRSSILSSEHMVWSSNGYGGRYDLIMMIEGRKLLIDLKTSKGIYPDYALQLAGYRWADGIMVPGVPNLYAMPELDGTAILHLRPELYPDTGWRLIEYPTVYEKDYIAFLATLELWRWKKEGRFLKSRLSKH